MILSDALISRIAASDDHKLGHT